MAWIRCCPARRIGRPGQHWHLDGVDGELVQRGVLAPAADNVCNRSIFFADQLHAPQCDPVKTALRLSDAAHTRTHARRYGLAGLAAKKWQSSGACHRDLKTGVIGTDVSETNGDMAASCLSSAKIRFCRFSPSGGGIPESARAPTIFLSRRTLSPAADFIGKPQIAALVIDGRPGPFHARQATTFPN